MIWCMDLIFPTLILMLITKMENQVNKILDITEFKTYLFSVLEIITEVNILL